MKAELRDHAASTIQKSWRGRMQRIQFEELKKFRTRFAAILGPFGYKFAEQFAELNKYYDKGRGIGRHGDVERGHGSEPGAVNCLKVGYHIPMLFSWYKSTKPVGQTESMGPVSVTEASFPIVTFGKKKWTTQTMAAAVTLCWATLPRVAFEDGNGDKSGVFARGHIGGGC